MSRRRFRVDWARSAVVDLVEIASYIALDSPSNALAVVNRIRGRAASLNSSPNRGRIVPELARFGIREFRELVVKPYRLIYRADRSLVHVLAVLDGRRDLEDVLLDRLVRQ